MEWNSLKDTEISNKWESGEYLIRYEDTIYGYQYIIYKNGKQIGSCQTKDGAMKKVESYNLESIQKIIDIIVL